MGTQSLGTRLKEALDHRDELRRASMTLRDAVRSIQDLTKHEHGLGTAQLQGNGVLRHILGMGDEGACWVGVDASESGRGEEVQQSCAWLGAEEVPAASMHWQRDGHRSRARRGCSQGPSSRLARLPPPAQTWSSPRLAPPTRGTWAFRSEPLYSCRAHREHKAIAQDLTFR